MTRANLLENLIYLILTFVQLSLLSSPCLASPNLEPPSKKTSLENSTDSTMPLENPSQAPLDSLILSEPHPNPSSDKRFSPDSPSYSIVKNHFVLTAGIYNGPYDDSKSKFIYLLGAEYKDPLNFSLWNHYGFFIGGSTHPLLYFSQESALRNYWKYLKSWSYRIQLEVDTSQNLGAFLSFNHYSGGVGLSFELTSQIDFSLHLLPLSSRGVGIESTFSYLIF